MHRKPLLLLTLAAVLLTGCRSHKKAPFESIEIQGEAMSLPALYSQLAETYRPWQDVYMPATLTMLSPAKMSMSSRIGMVRDQSIHISMRMLGMEAAVIHFTPDSVVAIDKYHKMFVAESLQSMLGGYPITLSDIQDLVLGQAFVPGEGSVANEPQVNLYYDSDTTALWVMEAVNPGSDIDWWCTATETDPPTLASVSFVLGDKAQVDCIFDDHRDTPAGIVAGLTEMGAFNLHQGLNAQIRLNLDDAKWDTGRNDGVKIPDKGYKRITMAMLLEAIKNI